MSWSVAAPNLLIGLREGLEAGLVVSILLAARRRSTPVGARMSSAPVWLGVLGAVTVAGSFAAVLTYSTSVLSSRGQEAVGGALSVLAVALVTGMVFWMRHNAASLGGHLRGEVQRAMAIGEGALAVTAFLAVGREGLETTLFLWTAVRASGQTVAPLVGAGLGLAAAVLLCSLLYRRAVRLNLAVFFNRTAVALIVIAAGVLAYGLGDLQDAGLLAGQRWIAFDLTAQINPSSWWASIVTGITELSPRMTVLQVAAWVTYLAVVIPTFISAGRPATAQSPHSPESWGSPQRTSRRWEQLIARRATTVAALLVAVPVVAAGATIAVLPAASAATTTTVTVTPNACAGEWTGGHTGPQTFMVDNRAAAAGEVDLEDAAGGVVAEIETLGPGTTAALTVTLSPGGYAFKCLLAGRPAVFSQTVQISGSPTASALPAVAPVTVADLVSPNNAYQRYAANELATLAVAVTTIGSDVQGGNGAAARTAWLAAQLDWERVGASYDSFGQLGMAIDGLPDGLAEGVADPDFTGLHRIEYGLWHGQQASTLIPVVDALSDNIATLRNSLNANDIAGDPTNLPIRAHEILEDALRDHLSGIDDEGAGAAYPETAADVEATREVLNDLSPLLAVRAPALLPMANRQINALNAALAAAEHNGQWPPPAATPRAARQGVDAAMGALLETLASIPDLLEVAPVP